MTLRILPFLTAGLLWNSGLWAAPAGPAGPLRLAPVASAQLDDVFWAPKLKTVRERSIPHSWRYVEGELRALRKAGGQRVEGELNGTWGEANLYKLLETTAYALAIERDPALEKQVDDAIALVAGAQQPDGYVHAYITNSRKVPWAPDFLDGSHDGYVLGHMIEAALEHHAATGKRTFLDVACKAADQACRHFLGTNGHPGFCGHAELEMALVELYRVVPEPRYLELAKAFVEWRGRGVVHPAGDTPRAYFQDQVPVRQQATLEGHAVRALFFATGVADLALETGDPDYRLAAGRFWDSTARRRINVAGGTGPRREHEAFGEDYELPNDGYYESCAACGLADFAQRMFLLERQSQSADVLERVLYNAILHGISLDGLTSYYQNPLSDTNNVRYNSWVCCPPNLSRTILQAGRYACAHGPGEFYFNLYAGGRYIYPAPEGPVPMRVETRYPWEGVVTVTLLPARPARFALNLRMPGWCRKAALLVNGAPVTPLPLTERGYLRVERVWGSNDTVALRMEMPVERVEAHPAIRDCAGKVALQRGPLVYGFEALDNGGDAKVVLGADPRFQTEFRTNLLGGVVVIRGAGESGKPFLAVPFHTLANRARSTQEVWAVQRGLKPSPEWWLGQIYRPIKASRVAQ